MIKKNTFIFPARTKASQTTTKSKGVSAIRYISQHNATKSNNKPTKEHHHPPHCPPKNAMQSPFPNKEPTAHQCYQTEPTNPPMLPEPMMNKHPSIPSIHPCTPMQTPSLPPSTPTPSTLTTNPGFECTTQRAAQVEVANKSLPRLCITHHTSHITQSNQTPNP